MPAYEKIDGVWREVWGAYVMVDGVWRSVDLSTKVDGEWKTVHIDEIKESDINEFHLVYKLNPDKRHPDFPSLKHNPNLPVTFSVTGENIGMNTSTKGVVYHYERFGEDEGILAYDAHLYAVLKNGCVVDVPSSRDTKVNNDDQRLPGPIPSIREVWITSRMKELSIQLEGYVLYEGFRYHMHGWNSLFDKNQFLLPDPYTSEETYREVKPIDPRILFPVEDRLSSYDTIGSIGIARPLTNQENMIGAYGTLDHTIDSIKVNGIIKPFSIIISD